MITINEDNFNRKYENRIQFLEDDTNWKKLQCTKPINAINNLKEFSETFNSIGFKKTLIDYEIYPDMGYCKIFIRVAKFCFVDIQFESNKIKVEIHETVKGNFKTIDFEKSPELIYDVNKFATEIYDRLWNDYYWLLIK